MLITSTDNKKIKDIRKLIDKKNSLKNELFVIEGDHLVKEAVKRNLLTELYILEGYDCEYDFPYDTVTEKVMKTLSDLKSIPRVIGVSKINSDKSFGNRIVILDDIQDPGNAGTVIRNCVAFGVNTIVFSKNSVSPYNEKVIRSTQGMIFNINVVIDDLEAIIKDIKLKGIEVIGTSLNTSNGLKNMPKLDKYAVIFGNEGNGISKEVQLMCDKLYKIEMNENCESLNVGVSCGIILYKLFEGK